MTDTTLTIGIVQCHNTADREANVAALEAAVAQAAGRGAHLVVLPELHDTLYFCQTEDVDCCDLAEPIPGPTTQRLAAWAQRHGIVIVGSVFERRGTGLYHNTAVVLERDGTLAGIYRKMHIPDDPGYYEKFYFTPGDTGFGAVSTSVGKLGVLVCWDQWFPEAARLCALHGADILVYPTAIGWDTDDTEEERMRQLDAWRTVQRGHAVANGIPVVAVNRVGPEPHPWGHGPGILFWGNSFVAGPQGELLHQAPQDAAETAVVTVDRSRSEAVRRIWPFLRDRRIDAYDGLLRRYLAVP